MQPPKTFTQVYCSLELVRNFATGSKGTELDPFFKVLSSAASRLVDKITGRYFGPSALVSGEVVSHTFGKWDNVLYTKFSPLVSILSLSDDVRSYSEATNIVADAETGRIETKLSDIDNLPLAFSRTPGAIVISYYVGQDLPAGQATFQVSSVPETIQVAAAMIAGNMSSLPDRLGIISRSRQDSSHLYDPALIPPAASALLAPYRRLAF